jgi:hypothetical protein
MRIVWFIPYAVSFSHTEIEFKLINYLSEKNFITLIQCDGVFEDFCSGMSYHGLDVTRPRIVKKVVCINCKASKKKLNTSLEDRVGKIEISELINKHKIAEIKNLNELKTLQELDATEVEGLLLGQYSRYSATLRNKAKVVQIDKEAVEEVRIDLTHSMITYFSIKELLRKNEFDMGVVYNGNYAPNRTFIEILKLNKIQALSVQTGSHSIHGKSAIAPSFNQNTFQELSKSKAWTYFKSKSVHPTHYDEVIDHLKNSSTNKEVFTYSRKVQNLSTIKAKKILGIKNNNPSISVLLSSPDEYEALIDSGIDFSLPNENISNILKAIVDLSVKQPNWNFIIRPHPRMFSNHRENKSSIYVDYLLENKDLMKPNIFFNLPEDNLSLYDLVKIIDIHFNFSSTAGLEIAAGGGKVLTIDSKNGFRYPSDVTPGVTNLDVNEIENSVIHLLNSKVEPWQSLAIKYYIFIFQIYEIRFMKEHLIDQRNYIDFSGLYRFLLNFYRSDKLLKIQFLKNVFTLFYVIQKVGKLRFLKSRLDNSENRKIDAIFLTGKSNLEEYLLSNIDNYENSRVES